MESIRNVFAIPELRNRVLFTFGILAIYRVGGHVPTPGINTEALQQFTQQAASNLFGLYDMFSGYNLSQMTVFALNCSSRLWIKSWTMSSLFTSFPTRLNRATTF